MLPHDSLADPPACPTPGCLAGPPQAVFEALAKHLGHPHLGRRRPSGLTMMEPVAGGASSASRGAAGASSWWSGLSGLVGGGGGGKPAAKAGAAGTPHRAPAVQGLYMFGGVGCGKTMLMDLFVSTAPPEFKVRGRAAA